MIIQDAYINHEFCHIYIAKTDNDLSDFDLQEGEVTGVFALDINKAILLFSDELESVQIEGKVWNDGQYQNTSRTLTKKDFCSYHDRVEISGYYLKVMIMAERYIQGQKALRI